MKEIILYKPFYKVGVTPKNKKYSVYVKGKNGPKLIHFGAAGYQHYFDRLGRYKDLNHLDEKRRENYRKRHAGDNYKNKDFPGYWSWNVLW